MVNEAYSVLMSVYKKEIPKYLYESLISMLNQTIKPAEIVLVKDGELTQELEDVLEQFKNEPIIKIVSLSENKGLGEALNIGLENCNYELVARMDTDDISRSDRCEKQLEMFNKNRLLSIVSSTVAEFSTDIDNINSLKRLPTKHEDIIKFSKKRNPFNHPAVMFKKSVVQKSGGYKHFQFFEDYYLWVRMIMSGAYCANINEPLVYMRANSNMYKRRGGITYLKCIAKFRWHLKIIGFTKIDEFLLSLIGQSIVAIFPNKTRMLFYRKFLRKINMDV